MNETKRERAKKLLEDIIKGERAANKKKDVMTDKQRTPAEIWAEIEKLFQELREVGGMEPATPPPAQKRNPVPAPVPLPQVPPPANPPGGVLPNPWLPRPQNPFIPTKPSGPFKIGLGTQQQPLPPRDQVCALARYFRDHPNEQSVMMVCNCPYCTVSC